MPSVLYCGDTSLDSAAAYLAGLLTHWGWSFEYVASDQALSMAQADQPRSLVVLSDYPAQRMATDIQSVMAEQVKAGAGLLMCGGWESFHGLGGDWQDTPIAAALPVEIADRDDRRNCDHPVFLQPETDSHPLLQGLPWANRPPLIGGYNLTTVKREATLLLSAQHYQAARETGGMVITPQEAHPLLAVATHGKGRTAALMTDVAPHWVGPLVDWGDNRVVAQAPGAEAIEVGDLYARFFHQLLSWTAGS